MNLDDNNLTTVQATVEKTPGGKPVINLLKPFLSGPLMVRGRVSHLRLLSGNEGGISLSTDGNQLTIDLEYYGYLSTSNSEELYYEYRINQPETPYSRHTAMITIMATAENDLPILHEAILTTDQPFDDSAYEEQLNQNDWAEMTVDEPTEIPNLESESILSGETEMPWSEESLSENTATATDNSQDSTYIEVSDAEPPKNSELTFDSDSPSESRSEGEENNKKFSFSSISPADSEAPQSTTDDGNETAMLSYEDLAPAPEPEINSLQPETDKALEDRSKEIDQAIAEADQLLEATLGIQLEDPPTAPDDNQSTDSSPEQALEKLINQIPDEQENIQNYKPEPKAETELEHIIDELSTITDNNPDILPGLTTAAEQRAEFVTQHQKHETVLNSLDTYIFNLEDFDKQPGIPVDKLEQVKLNTVPSAGSILYNRQVAKAGQEISRIDLLTGRLTFKPDEHFADRGNAQFFFAPRYSAQYSPQQLFKFSYIETEAEPFTLNKEEISRDVSMEIDITADNGASVLTSGNMTIRGKDSTHLEIIAGTVAGAYGSFTVNSNGYWTYSLDKNQPAILGLRDNNCLSEYIVIPTEQGDGHGVLLTIICRNKQVDILVSQGNT